MPLRKKSKLEIAVEKLFRNLKTKLINTLGRDGLFDDQILRMGRALFGMQFIGVYSSDEGFPLRKNGMYVFNVDKLGGPGSHWIGVYLTAKHAYIYDSFGRASKSLISPLTQKLQRLGYKVHDSDRRDSEQRGESQVCGHSALAWLMIIKSNGIRAAMLI